jgi:hypothetical protein
MCRRSAGQRPVALLPTEHTQLPRFVTAIVTAMRCRMRPYIDQAARLPRRALPWRGPPGARRAILSSTNIDQHGSSVRVRLAAQAATMSSATRARRSAWYLCECLTRFGSCLRATGRSTRRDPLPGPSTRASSARAEPLPAQSIMPRRGSVDSPATLRGVWQLSGEGTQPLRCCRAPRGRHNNREGGRDDPEAARIPSAVSRQYLARVQPSGAAASWRRHLGERYMGLVVFVRCGGG